MRNTEVMPANDRRFLEKHGQQWRVVVYVPDRLRPIIGKAAFKRGLKTDSLKVAQAKRWPVVSEFKRMLDKAEAIADAGSSSYAIDPLTSEALEWREALTILDDVAHATEVPSDLEHALDARRLVAESILPKVEREHGPAKAREFSGIIEGKRTPLALHHAAFLQEHGHFAKRTMGDHRRALTRLTDFATTSGYSCTVEVFSERRAAGLFTSHLAALGTHPKTANKLVSMLAGYWRWMIRKGLAPGTDQKRDNPWLGQSLPVRQLHRVDDGYSDDRLSDGKRAFTDAEVARLIYSETPETGGNPLLGTFMLIGALSGMRIDEIARLRLQHVDLAHGTLAVRSGKTAAGRRTIPIHSKLRSIITEQYDKASGVGSSWLFLELPEPKPESLTERSTYIGKRFGRHRMRLGIHEKPEGQRQSNVDFHSFRRWFITKAEQAGVPPNIISTVVGHAEGRKGMTLGVYSGGPSLDQLRACIEAVRLPQEAT